MNSLSRYAGLAVLLYIFNDDKGSPVVVELFFILLLDVYSSSSGLQLIDWAEGNMQESDAIIKVSYTVLQSSGIRENDCMSFDEYYNEASGRSFDIADVYDYTTTWLHKYDHMARYFPIFLTFGARFQFLTTEVISRYNLHLN